MDTDIIPKKIQIEDSDISLFADRSTLKEVILLLAYIRDALESNAGKTLTLDIGRIRSGGIKFTVNNMEVPEYKCPDTATIC